MRKDVAKSTIIVISHLKTLLITECALSNTAV